MPWGFGGTDRNYDEWYLGEGDAVTAAGAVVSTADLDLSWPRLNDETVPDRALVAPADGRLLLSDTDRLGLRYRTFRWHPRLVAALVLFVVLLAYRFG